MKAVLFGQFVEGAEGKAAGQAPSGVGDRGRVAAGIDKKIGVELTQERSAVENPDSGLGIDRLRSVFGEWLERDRPEYLAVGRDDPLPIAIGPAPRKA